MNGNDDLKRLYTIFAIIAIAVIFLGVLTYALYVNSVCVDLGYDGVVLTEDGLYCVHTVQGTYEYVRLILR